MGMKRKKERDESGSRMGTKRKQEPEQEKEQDEVPSASKRKRDEVAAPPVAKPVAGPAPPAPPVQDGAPAAQPVVPSLDALAKAKRVLQQQKELAEKMKKLKALPKVSKPAADKPESGAVASATPATSNAMTSGHSALPLPGAIPASLAGGAYGSGLPGIVSSFEAVKRAQDIVSRMGFPQAVGTMPLMGLMPGQGDDMGFGQSKTVKAPVLRLDAQGREVDERGNVVDRPKFATISTLKVNINKRKKEAFQILRPELEEDPVDNPFFDARMGVDKKKLIRSKKPTFQFVEEGKWSKQAEMLRLRNQFGEAKAKEIKAKQASLAKAKAEADVNPNLIELTERALVKEEKSKDPIPDVEWWDAVLLTDHSYNGISKGEFNVRTEKITIYVEHPVPIEPPAELAPPPPQPLKLTKKEQKKLRTQRRLAKEKDRQEMIRQGLLEPPKSKVKMSNLMKVLGAEATQDPTKLEYEIRSAAAEREQAHTDRNLARKLTPAERREKKEKKLFDDPHTLETIVSVYRVNDFSHPQTRFKVDVNAQENRLTGCVVVSDSISVVVVEGGAKSIKRYGKLMLRRINWATAVTEAEEGDEDARPRENKCVLVWQGSVAKPSFDKFLIQTFRSDIAARKYLADAGVGHYWDLSLNYIEE